MATALRLALLDDHDLMRQCLADYLRQWPHCADVLEAENGVAYERRVREGGHVHIALVDLYMPQRDGFETIRWIVRHHPRTLPIAISQDTRTDTVRRAVQAGSRGFISKGSLRSELFPALDHLRTMHFHYNNLVSKALRRLWEQADEQRHPDQVAASLTPREREFLLLYARAPFPQRAEIAVRMGISETTVESLRKNVVRRTGCHSKPELMEFVKRVGWG